MLVPDDVYRLLVDRITDYAVFMLDPAGNVLTWNEGAERLNGYTAEEIVGRHFSIFYRRGDVSKCALALAAAEKLGRFADDGIRVRKDGTERWVTCVMTPMRAPDGTLLGFAKVTSDLSAQRVADEALRQSDERLRLLVESVKDYAIFMLDPNGVIMTWNVGAERIKGYRADEIIGRHFSVFYPDEDIRAGKCERELVEAARDGRFEEEAWRLRKDGTRFWANVVITALRDAKGELVGFAKVSRDLTERRLAEQQRLRLAEQAGARESAERFIGLLRRLHSVAGSLAGASTPEEVAKVIVEQGAAALDATTGAFVREAEGALHLVATHGIPGPLAEAWSSYSRDRGTPLATAIRTGKAQWIETFDDAQRYPDLEAQPSRVASAAALPLVLGDRVIGAVGFRFDEARTFAPEERGLMEALSAQAAQAFDRATAYAAEIEARRRLEALGALSDALARSLTAHDVARAAVENGLAAAHADGARLFALDGRTGELAVLAEHGGVWSDAAGARFRPRPGDALDRAVARGEALWAETPAVCSALPAGLASENGPSALWCVPLVGEGRAIGVLAMAFHAARKFSQDDRTFAATVGGQCAEALLRAQRLEAERDARAMAESLQASLSTTLRSIGDAVIAADARGCVTVMNPIAESLTGWREADAIGKPLSDVFSVIDEETRVPVASPAEKVLELGAVVGSESDLLLVSRDGREIAIDDSGAPIRSGDGLIEGVVVVFRDVSRRKREARARAFLVDATAALAESLDYEATLAKVARLAVPHLADWCAVDVVVAGEPLPKRLAVAHVDPAKVALAKELDEKYPMLADAPTGVPNVLRTGRTELYSEVTDEMLVAVSLDDEHLRIARELGLRSAMVVPLVSKGHVLGAMSFVFAESDRTYGQEDVRLAEDLAHRCADAIENARLYLSEQRARQSADVASRAKDEFLAIVSHELRTPLNAIMGWAKMMSTPGFDEARRGRAVETIERNSVAMAQLIEDLLDMSRIISGNMRLEVQPVDLGAVIDLAIASIGPTADTKDIVIAAKLDRSTPPISGDPTRLQQVVWNLLSNAVKFTPRAGRVEIVLSRAGSSAELAVTDSGVGIASAFLPHVFDAFRQEDSGSTRSRGGLGLGLSITRQLVELHGGVIDASSEGVGRGATFTVRFPIPAVTARPARSVGAAASWPKAAFARPPALRGVRVLVVDDDDDARVMVKSILDDCGCNVTVASSVDEALSSLDQAFPDVLVSDIGMPGRDGYELIRRVRALPPEAGGDLPAAALTAYARADDRRRMLDAGYSTHVSKPVEPAELVMVVANLARRVGGDRRAR